MLKKSISIFSFLILMTSFAALAALPQTPPPIKIGMSTALTGVAQRLGQNVKQGIEIYFAKINAKGGIAGRKLELSALDDQYEPVQTVKNMRELTADNSDILAIIGNVGTPTAVVAVPIANEKHVLLFGAFSGSNVLRKTPPDRYVINLRASYEVETAAIIKGLLSIGIKPEEIAFFIQNDSYGDAGYQGAIKALKASGYTTPENLAVGRYTRNTLNVEEGLASLLDAAIKPKAIIIVGAYAPVAKFIKLAKQEFPNTLFLNVSFVGSEALLQELGKDSEQIIVTQVVPLLNVDLPAVNEYLNDLKQYGNKATPNFSSFEGYLDAKLFVIGLAEASAQNKLTREGIIDVFEKMKNVDIGIGVKISYDKNDHEGLSEVWPTIIKNNKFIPLIWSEIKQKK